MTRGLRYLLEPPDREVGSRLKTVAIKAERWRRRDRWRYAPVRRRRAVDAIPVERPIFVLGMQGGGTTLVARCLLRHDRVVSMSGNSSYWVATDEMGFVRNRMRRLPPSLWSSAHRDDLRHPVLGTEHASVYACDELLPWYRRTAADATPADAARFKRLLREHIAVYARDPARARFVDKTHTYTVKVPYLDRLLEGHDPCFVLVTRNPYSACFRAVRRKPPSWGDRLGYAERLHLVAEHWRNSMQLALEDGAATGRFVAVRFEDFVADPATTIRSVCDVVGLDYDDSLVPRPGDRMPFATLPWDRKWYPLVPDEWQSRVDELDARIIGEICGDVAETLGYGREEDAARAVCAAR